MSEGNGLEMTTANGKKDADFHRKLSREEKLREAKIEDQVCTLRANEKHVKIFNENSIFGRNYFFLRMLLRSFYNLIYF